MTKDGESAKRVFILGAGASKACGLPLTNELLPDIVSSLGTKPVRKRALNFIKYLYPYFELTWGNYPNVEELLSLMDVYVEFSKKVKSSHKFEPDEVEELKDELLTAISVSLSERTAKVKIQNTQFFRLAQIMRPGDVVVSFNWDVLLESALTELKRGWNYELKGDKLALLKPHGSVDWFDGETTRIKASLTSPVIEKIGRLRVFQYFRMPRLRSRMTPVIVPPLIRKKWKYREFDRIWRCAWRALRTANEIHIIGFSLPPADLHVKFVIRSAVRINEETRTTPLKVTVVNPDKTVYLRFDRLMKTKVHYFETGFGDIELEELTAVR
ncbi:MAG: hypothetical protein GZ088_01580 [Acidipila sp.]|nr:hypothetical protein [Acidipila sp.]